MADILIMQEYTLCYPVHLQGAGNAIPWESRYKKPMFSFSSPLVPPFTVAWDPMFYYGTPTYNKVVIVYRLDILLWYLALIQFRTPAWTNDFLPFLMSILF